VQGKAFADEFTAQFQTDSLQVKDSTQCANKYYWLFYNLFL